MTMQDTAEMWKGYGSDGVAIRSTYKKLKVALERCDAGKPMLGLVRYGTRT